GGGGAAGCIEDVKPVLASIEPRPVHPAGDGDLGGDLIGRSIEDENRLAVAANRIDGIGLWVDRERTAGCGRQRRDDRSPWSVSPPPRARWKRFQNRVRRRRAARG